MSTQKITTISGLYNEGMKRPKENTKQFDMIDLNKDGILSGKEIIHKRRLEALTTLSDGARDILTGTVMAGAAGCSAKLAILTSETVVGIIFFIGLSATCLTITKNSIEKGVNKFQQVNQEIKKTHSYAKEIKHNLNVKQ